MRQLLGVGHYRCLRFSVSVSCFTLPAMLRSASSEAELFFGSRGSVRPLSLGSSMSLAFFENQLGMIQSCLFEAFNPNEHIAVAIFADRHHAEPHTRDAIHLASHFHQRQVAILAERAHQLARGGSAEWLHHRVSASM